MRNKNRREFLKDSAAAGAGAAGISLLNATSSRSATAASADKVLGANDRIRVGLIGCGGQGRADLRQMLKIKNIECVALCDVDDEQTARAVKMVQTEASQNPSLTTRDFKRVLDDKDIDAVIIGTPDHWHAVPTILACQAGKDVYVEKPLSISIGEGRVMDDSGPKSNRIDKLGKRQITPTT